MRWTRSLRGRLTLAMLLVFALGLGASFIFSHQKTHQEEQELKENALRSHVCELLASFFIAEGRRVTIALPERADANQATGLAFAYTLYDVARRPVTLSPGLREPLPFPEFSGAADARCHVQLLGPEQRIALTVRAPDGYTLVLTSGQLDPTTRLGILFSEAYDLLVLFVPFSMTSFVLIWLTGRWSLRPLARASQEAAAIGPANPSGRVSAHGLPLEVRPLVDAANNALERLDHAYVAQRRFTADAAHELRTPLAVLSLRLQQAKLATVVDWPAVERDLAQMNRIISQLMDLAHREDPARLGHPAELRPIDLSRIVREAAATVLPLAEKNGRPLEIKAPAVVTVHGRADDLRDAVRNLLDNALAHGEGAVCVRVGRTSDDMDERALVEVADQGSGIADDLREAVFDRFRKAVSASPGAGLGLAIVRQIVQAHDGEVRVQSGPGCRVQILLPFSG